MFKAAICFLTQVCIFLSFVKRAFLEASSAKKQEGKKKEKLASLVFSPELYTARLILK